MAISKIITLWFSNINIINECVYIIGDKNNDNENSRTSPKRR